MNSILKQPSAWIPIALSLAMLAFLITYLAVVGIPTPEPDADEGTAAHLFQLWLVLEVLMITFFTIKWVPQAPTQALFILVIQIVVALAACFPVFYFQL